MTALPGRRIQGLLLWLAGVFLFLYCLALTLSPAARARDWAAGLRWNHWIFYAAWVALFVFAHIWSVRWMPGGDPYLLPVAALLSGWGGLTIWRLFPSFGLRQTVWLGASVVALALCFRLPGDLGFLRRYKYLWLTAGLVLTALTLAFGTNPLGFGPRLWLGGYGVYFQPSEPLKLLLVIYLAAYLADRKPFVPRLLPLLAPTLLMVGLVVVLLLFQRDLGTATIFLFLYTAMVYIASGRKRILLAGMAAAVGAGVVGYALFDVVRLRVDAWLNPWVDPSGRSYQIVQSLIAVASGGLLGRGPGLGNPGLVPIPHSDFIFVAIVEESGLLGAVGICLLLGLLVSRGLRTAMSSPDGYRRYLAAGLTTHLAAQGILIMGGNLRLLPLTGVTLPFVSYGGTSLLTSFLSLALLLVISDQERMSESHPLVVQVKDIHLHEQLGGFLIAGLCAIALVSGWWAVYRGPGLVTRTDNPRRAIADRYVRRGALLDRNNEPLSTSTGNPGEYIRHYVDADLGSVAGYNHPVYGQSGLEASLDDYLRGMQGHPALTLLWNEILYGQPPPGLDVRLTLDVRLQRTADEQLGDRTGAIVLMNAAVGDILALASHPTFDPNQLDQVWAELVQDPRAPLFNRAVLGKYPQGAVLGPLVLGLMYASSDEGVVLPPLQATLNVRGPALGAECARLPEAETWEAAVAAGCPKPVSLLEGFIQSAAQMPVRQVLRGALEFTTQTLPGIPLGGDIVEGDNNATQPISGEADSRISPMQVAMAAAVLSGDGIRPVPRLVLGVNDPDEGWVILPDSGLASEVLPKTAADAVARALMVQGLPIWQSLARLPDGESRWVTWYVAGTLPEWNGVPMALAVLLEEDNPDLAVKIGQAVFMAALRP